MNCKQENTLQCVRLLAECDCSDTIVKKLPDNSVLVTFTSLSKNLSMIIDEMGRLELA